MQIILVTMIEKTTFDEELIETFQYENDSLSTLIYKVSIVTHLVSIFYRLFDIYNDTRLYESV